MSRDMRATRLHVINNDDEAISLRVVCELLSLDYKLVKITCGDEIIDKGCVVEELFKTCFDELEFITCNNFDEVVGDLYYAVGDSDVNMEFVVEVEDGYVYLTIDDVRRIVDDVEYGEE